VTYDDSVWLITFSPTIDPALIGEYKLTVTYTLTDHPTVTLATDVLLITVDYPWDCDTTNLAFLTPITYTREQEISLLDP
jgi:hypothetical protein